MQIQKYEILICKHGACWDERIVTAYCLRPESLWTIDTPAPGVTVYGTMGEAVRLSEAEDLVDMVEVGATEVGLDEYRELVTQYNECGC